MSIAIDARSLQIIEAVVAGPDDANRLITLNGTAAAPLILPATSTDPNTAVTRQERFVILVGPQLTRRQFHRAIANAFPMSIGYEASPSNVEWLLGEADADWDDESQRVALSVTIHLTVKGPTGARALLSLFGFQVTILASL